MREHAPLSRSGSGRAQCSGPKTITFGCRLNALESEVMRTPGARKPGLDDAILVNTCAVTAEAVRQARQAIRKARRENPDAPHRRHRLRRADRPAELRRHARGRPRPRQCREADAPAPMRRISASPAASASASTTSCRCARPPAIWSRASTAAPAPSSRCRTAATTAAPSASSPTAAAIRARCRWAPSSTRSAALVDNGYARGRADRRRHHLYGADLPGAPRSAGSCARSCATCRSCRACASPRSTRSRSTPTLMAAIAEEERLMPHLHLSLQAGDDMILKRMKRRHCAPTPMRFCRRGAPPAARHRLRRRPDRRLPDRDRGRCSRTRCRIVDDCGLTYLHVFPFSPRPGTPAARMPQLDRALVKERAARLRAARARRPVAAHLAAETGAIRPVLVERERHRPHRAFHAGATRHRRRRARSCARASPAARRERSSPPPLAEAA